MTIGMSGLAIASLVQSGFDLHWLARDQVHAVGLILVSVPFLLQLIACVFAYLARDGATGAALGTLSATWLGMGLIHLTSTPGSRSGAMGLLLLAAGGVLMLTAAAVALIKPLPGTVFALAGVRFIISGIHELGGSGTWSHAAGIVGLVILGLAGYCVLAFDLEGEMHRPVLPTLRRSRARAALSDVPEQAIDGVLTEPGVRQTT
jgi:succinate-acetate transporter protein